MKRIFIIFAVLLAGCCGIYLFNSCVKKDFDAPPDASGYDPGLTVTHTISELLTMPYGTAIGDDVVIKGIVVMDDHSGNYYKSIVIEDSTGGIQVLLDQNSLYNDYPVGRKVYVKCKGLYLGANNGTPQLGNIPDNTGGVSNIPFNLISDHLVKANYPNAIIPDTFTITQLKNAGSQYVNRLVAIKDIEFVEAALDSTYAQPASLGSATNHTLEDCSGTILTLRTSGYASFQPVNLPVGKGVIVGLYTQYISPYNQTSVTPQLYIRDTSDVHFTEARCDGSSGPPPPVGDLITIDSVRNIYNSGSGGAVNLPEAHIAGVIISDIDNGNVSSNNYIIEDGSHKGIILYVPQSNKAYKLGDSVIVNLPGTTVEKYIPSNQTVGNLEINGLTSSNIIKLSTGNTVEPITVTIAQFNANVVAYESVLVKILNATANNGNGGTFGGSKPLNDGTGTLYLYTAIGNSPATFANAPLPTEPKTFIGIGTIYSTPEIKMRNLNDVQ